MFGVRFQILRILGIPIRIDLSWIAIAVLVTWSLAASYFPGEAPDLSTSAHWVMGLLGAFGLFGSILLHELAHSVVARWYGVGIRGITLFIFGGVAEMEHEPPSPVAEFLIAIAGPLLSFALAGAFLVFGVGLALAGGGTPLGAVFNYLWVINGLLATFNLIPAFPLDGGRVLRSILWQLKGSIRWATRVTSTIGSIFGIGLIGLGTISFMAGQAIGGVWLALIGLFVFNAARSSYRHLVVQEVLRGEPVERFMTTNPVVVPRYISLAQFVDEFVYRHHHKLFPVVDGDALIGAIHTRRLKAVPRDEWERQSVGALTEPITGSNSIRPASDALSALLQMSRFKQSRLLVVDESGRLVGMLSLGDLTALLSLKLELEEDVAT